MKKLNDLTKKRKKIIKKTSKNDIKNDFVVNIVGNNLHPKYQYLIVKNIIAHNENEKTFYFASYDKKYLSLFRPGQYITIVMNINNNIVSRPYYLSSSQNDALNNMYRITIHRIKEDILTNYLLDNTKINDVITSLEASGKLFPSIIRDKNNIVCLAYEDGICPFISMARTAFEGNLDKNITIFYYTKLFNNYIYVEELNQLSKNPNIKIVYVCDEEVQGIEKGKITKDLIKKYVTSQFTVFACGTNEFYDYLKEELKDLELGNKDFRYEKAPIINKLSNEVVNQPEVVEIIEEAKPKPIKKGKKEEEEVVEEKVPQKEVFPIELPKIYNIKVFTHENEYNVKCFENQTILNALENNKIPNRSKCKAGECGYCRSLLLWGTINIKEGFDYRRKSDINLNYIHPCCSYPTSDITIKIDI